jgi:hypothetical protein
MNNVLRGLVEAHIRGEDVPVFDWLSEHPEGVKELVKLTWRLRRLRNNCYEAMAYWWSSAEDEPDSVYARIFNDLKELWSAYNDEVHRVVLLAEAYQRHRNGRAQRTGLSRLKFALRFHWHQEAERLLVSHPTYLTAVLKATSSARHWYAERWSVNRMRRTLEDVLCLY